MHRVLIIVLLTVVASTATAKQEPLGTPINYSTPYSVLSSSSANTAFIRELQRKVEAAGYTDVQVEPRMFFATAMDATGNPVGLMVDADTETTIEIDGQGPAFDKLACEKPRQER